VGIPDWGCGIGSGRLLGPPLAFLSLLPQGGHDDANHAADALDEDGRGAKTRPGLDRDKLGGNTAAVVVGRGGAPDLRAFIPPSPGGRVCNLAADALDEDEGFKTRPGLDRDKLDELAASVEAGRVGVPEQMAGYAAASGP